MARRIDPDSDRIPHPDIQYAYLKVRNGMWHGVYRDNAQTTHLKASKKNIIQAMDRLTKRIEAILEGKEYVSPIHAQVNRKKISDVLSEYLRIHANRVSNETIQRYIQIYQKYLVEDLFVDETDKIRDMILSVKEQKKQHTNTQSHDLTILNAVFKHAVEAGYCTRSPIMTAMIPTKVKSDIELISFEEIETIFSHLRSGKNYERYKVEREENIRFYRMLMISAMRPGEAIKMKVSDLEKDGYRIDGKRSNAAIPNIRYFPKKLFPELDEVIDEQKHYSAKKKLDKLWSWVHYQKPGSNLKDAIRACQLNDNYNLYSFRKFALNKWEKELLIPEEVRLMLAGHSKAVKGHYFTKPNAAETKKIIEGFLHPTSGIRQES